MKQIILDILKENTHTEGRYIGGGDEPSIIVITGSDDQDKDEFLSQLADEISAAINKTL